MENKRNGIVGTSGPRPVGIICALEVELKDLLAELRDREDVAFNGYEFHCGRFRGKSRRCWCSAAWER